MLIHIYRGSGEIRDNNDGNVNDISISMEVQQHLRTWHAGMAFLGQVVPVIPGKELPPEQYQFVIRQSRLTIEALHFTFNGGKGFLYAEKTSGQPLRFQEWSLGELLPGGAAGDTVYSDAPPQFEYLDFSPWDCYSSVIPNTPEYGKLAPVIDLSSDYLHFSNTVPSPYGNGAKLTLKVIQQTCYEVA